MRGISSRRLSALALLALLCAGFLPVINVAQAATTPTTLNIGAVIEHPITSLSQLDSPYPGFFLYNNAGVMALWAIYPSFLFGNGTYVNDGLIQSTDTIASNNTYIVHLRTSGWCGTGAPVTAYDFYASLLAVNGLGSPPYNYKVIDNSTISIQVPIDPKLSINGLNIGSYIYGPDIADVPVLWDYAQWAPIVKDIAGNFTQVQAGNATVLSKLTALEAAQTFPQEWNGPYCPTSATSSEILMTKNPYYWDAAKITVPQVIIHQFTSASALDQALVSGQLDFYFGGQTINDNNGGVLPTNFQAVMPSYMQQIPSAGYTGPTLFFNNATVNVNVRSAIAYVLNRTEVAAAGGVSYTALSIPAGLSSGMFGNYPGAPCNSACQAQLNPYNQNIANATSLMQKGGFTQSAAGAQWKSANGTALTLTLLNAQSTDSTWLNMALDISSQLSAFGINVNILNPANPTGVALTGKGFDMYMTGFGWFPTSWDIYRPAYIYDGTPYPVMKAGNVTVMYNGTKTNTNQIVLFRQSDNGITTSAVNAADQKEAWLVNHYLPYLPMAQQNPITYLNTNDFSWPAASSPIWGVIIGNDPGAAVVVAQEAGELTAATAVSSSTTTSSAASTVTVTSTATTTSTSTSTSTATSTSTSTSSSLAITNPSYILVAIAVIAAMLVVPTLMRKRNNSWTSAGTSPPL
ncbi:MAG: ABC transporter substrate-binding protein [Thaumarchaeota archaeon]|nr:ABC transporter substrate-binding protein [Nitrososphaerota archaeon]